MQIPLNELLYSLSHALDFIERELLGTTTNHGKRAAFITSHLCGTMGLTDEETFDGACCAILHDNALTSYMLEAGPEGIRRFEHFKNHCARGEQNARAFPFAGNAEGIILNHHENWDGSGFHGLGGTDIPLRASILRLADNMDLRLAMGDGRENLEREIREHVEKFSGRFYAPRTVEALNDSLTPEFLRGLTDEGIDAALPLVVPAVRADLSAKQLLRVCTIFAVIIDAKSPFTQNHSTGLVEKLGRLADCFNLEEEHRDKLMIAGYLHDVGKLSTPPAILEKPGPLTPEEYAVMQNHVAETENILSGVKGLEDITRWASAHHETLDGNGYHNGYSAADISLEGRMIACCDVFQALTEDRPYRKGMDFDAAMKIMESMAERNKLDPGIVRVIREEFAVPA